MKKIITFCVLFSGLYSFSQGDFLVSEKGDTTFCDITDIETLSGGTVMEIVYKVNNTETTIKGADECRRIKTIRLSGELYGKPLKLTLVCMPIDPEDASSRVLHMTLLAMGEINVYMLQGTNVKTNKKGVQSIGFTSIAKNYYSAKLGYDAKRMLLSNKYIKGSVIPYMNECSKFKTGYGGKLGVMYIATAAHYYNENCE